MITLLVTGVLAFGVAGTMDAAATSGFTGQWRIDPAKSPSNGEKTLALDLKEQAGEMTFTREYQDDRGKQVSSHFTCSVGQKSCEFDENGHKASVSIWYNGPEFVALKTNGDKRDSTVEWHLRLSDDGKLLTVSREIMDPGSKIEKLVFNKSESSPPAQISNR